MIPALLHHYPSISLSNYTQLTVGQMHVLLDFIEKLYSTEDS